MSQWVYDVLGLIAGIAAVSVGIVVAIAMLFLVFYLFVIGLIWIFERWF